jgi:RNA polymerase sigma-70 factor, ECF subfamily
VAPVEESVWRDYRTLLFAFVLKRVSDAATAEDIVHDVLVRAYEKRDTVRRAHRFESWLYQITRNAIVDHYRARRPTEPLPPDLATPDDTTDRSAMRELASCMQPLVGTLPEHYRDALSLSELQGLTQRETAERLGLSLSGAKSRVQRARRLLEQKLLDCCRVEVDSRGTVVDYESRNGCTDCGPTPTVRLSLPGPNSSNVYDELC